MARFRRFKKSRRYGSRGGKIAKIASRVVRKALKRTQELKYIDNGWNVNYDYGATCTSITDIGQGDTDSTRDGDKCLPKSIKLRLGLTAGDTTNFMRLMIIRWHSNVSTLAAGNVLQYLSSALAPFSPLSHDGRSEFNVIWDRTYVLGTQMYPVLNIKKFIKLAPHPIKFSAAGTDGRDKLFLIGVSDSAAAAHPNVSGYIRVEYTDS